MLSINYYHLNFNFNVSHYSKMLLPNYFLYDNVQLLCVFSIIAIARPHSYFCIGNTALNGIVGTEVDR